MNASDTTKVKFLLSLGAVVGVLALGYFLRTHYARISPLPYSPYDLLQTRGVEKLFDASVPLDQFTKKSFNYPLAYVLRLALGEAAVWPWVYVAGVVTIFLFGWAVSGRRLGGMLSLAAYAVGPENLLVYTNGVNPAGVCYVLSWLTLLGLYRYWVLGRDSGLLVAGIAGTLAIVSYHTGAVALVLLLWTILGSMVASSQPIDKRAFALVAALTGVLLYWLVLFDINQLILIRGALVGIDWVALLFIAVIFVGPATALLFARAVRPWILHVLSLGSATVLMVLPISPITLVLGYTSVNYFVSARSLNVYLVQAILLFVYFLLFHPILFSSAPTDKKTVFFRGWFIGVLVVFAALAVEGYLARILDYGAPLAYVLFGWYWSQRRPLRPVVVGAILCLLVFSQHVIFRDPYSLRRYYTVAEVKSAQQVASLDLPGLVVSDLRTAALFDYVGNMTVSYFGKNFNNPRRYFYQPERVVAEIREQKPKQNIYLILSSSMRHIVYGVNFETTPLPDDTFAFYINNFPVVYRDDNFFVVEVNKSE